MHDAQITLHDLKSMIKKMVDERDWNQFHSPKNLAMNISAEANELLEHFIWVNEKSSFEKLSVATDKRAIEDELADVMIGLCAFANACDIDIAQAFARKIKEVQEKYPVDKVYGKSLKYNQYEY